MAHIHSVGAAPSCGCAVHDSGRKAVAVDPDIRDRNLKRLRRIEGQVRGLQRMIDDDEYCIDVLTQIVSVTKALQGVGLGLLDEHVRHCVRSADPDDAEAKISEATRAIERLIRS